MRIPLTAPAPAVPLVTPTRFILLGTFAQLPIAVPIAVARVGALTPTKVFATKLALREDIRVGVTGINHYTHNYAKICFLLPCNPFNGEPKG